MKDLLKEIKYNRNEYKITNIIENYCDDVIKCKDSKNFGKKFKDNGGNILYWNEYNKELHIFENNIINSQLFKDFNIAEVISVINKYCNNKIIE